MMIDHILSVIKGLCSRLIHPNGW